MASYRWKTVAFVVSAVSLYTLVQRSVSAQSASRAMIDYVAKLNELVKKASDDELNAEPFYRKAFALCGALPPNTNVDELLRWPTEFGKEQQSVLRKWIHANADALAQLRLAAKRPSYWFQYQGLSTLEIDQEGHIRMIRDLFFALMLRAKWKALEGDVKGAMEDVLLCYRFDSDMKKRLLLIEQGAARTSLRYTWGTGWQILDRTQVDNTSMRMLQEELALRAKDQDFLLDFRGDELATLDKIQWLSGPWPDTQRLESLKERILWRASDFWGTYIPPEQMSSLLTNRTREELEGLVKKSYMYYTTVTSKTSFEWHEEGIDWDRAKRELVDGNLLLLLWVPYVPWISEVGFRCRVERDALITTLALLRYRNDRGSFPDDLKELMSAGYVSRLPPDPYSDGPLIYKRIGDNFTLYSVGVDFKDDGGKHSPKWGLEAGGGDFVFWPVQYQ